MPIELSAQIFTAESVALVTDLNCGSDKFGEIANEWIKCRDPLDSALKAINERQTTVLLYYVDNQLAGFGSIGTTILTIKKKPVQHSVIPHVGLAWEYHRFPKDVSWEQRVSTCIMLDLISRAEEMKHPRLLLWVHQDNICARKLYDRLGFLPHGSVSQDGHQKMVMMIPRSLEG